MHFSSQLSRIAQLDRAVDECATAILAELGGAPDVLFPFYRADDPNDYRRVPDLIAARFPGVPMFGCSSAGVIGRGHEEEDVAALSLTAARLPGARVRLVHLDPDDVIAREDVVAEKLALALAIEPGTSPDALVLVDPFTIPPDGFIAALDQVLPRSVKLGGLPSAGPVPRTTMLYGHHAHRSGALVLLIEGDVRLRSLVAQGVRPIGTPHLITKVEDQAIRELDGKPALEAMQATFRSLTPRDREIAKHSLFVGVEMETGSVEVRPDRLLVRNLLGVAPESGSIGVAAQLNRLDVIHFVLRDSQRATEELTALLAAAKSDGATPFAALLFSCMGRGRHLFGRVDHDPELFSEVFPTIQLGGFFGSGEIAPVAGHTFLHGYTSAFALFEKR